LGAPFSSFLSLLVARAEADFDGMASARGLSRDSPLRAEGMRIKVLIPILGQGLYFGLFEKGS